MFRIIGGDNKHYGPVPAGEVQEWIRLGRAGAQTQAQREGETEWKPLASFPEFADAFAGSALSGMGGAPSPEASPALPPAGGPPDPDRLTDEAMARADGVG